MIELDLNPDNFLNPYNRILRPHDLEPRQWMIVFFDFTKLGMRDDGSIIEKDRSDKENGIKDILRNNISTIDLTSIGEEFFEEIDLQGFSTVLNVRRFTNPELNFTPRNFEQIRKSERSLNFLQSVDQLEGLCFALAIPLPDYMRLVKKNRQDMASVVVAEARPIDGEPLLELLSETNTGDTIETDQGLVVGCIDDGLAYQHERFTHFDGGGNRHSRFVGMLPMSADLDVPQNNPGSNGPYRPFDPELNNLISTSLTSPKSLKRKQEIYEGIGRRVLGNAFSPQFFESFGHGTAVLDVAAGADANDLNDPIRQVPLLGAQLPPEVFADSSGSLLPIYYLTGLDWMLGKCQRLRYSDLHIPLSLGYLAGQKNDSDPFYRGIEALMQKYGPMAEADGKHRVNLHLYVAYGNSFFDQQVGGFRNREAGQEAEQIVARSQLVLQPEDHTPTFVHVKMLEGTLETQVSLQGPGDQVITKSLQSFDLAGSGSQDYLLMLEPTSEQAPVHQAPGVYALTIRGTPDQNAQDPQIIVQVQRGDDSLVHKTGARQAYLEGDTHATRSWGPGTADFEQDDSAGATKPEYGNRANLNPQKDGLWTAGTHNALANLETLDKTESVGALMKPAYGPSGLNPDQITSVYTGGPSHWSNSSGPTTFQIVDEGAYRGGMIVAGFQSQSATIASGTSFAAPLRCRQKIEEHLSSRLGIPDPSAPPTRRNRDFEQV